MTWRGIRSVEEIEQEAADNLKKWCKEHNNWECDGSCGSFTAQNWCANHPQYGEGMVGTFHPLQ